MLDTAANTLPAYGLLALLLILIFLGSLGVPVPGSMLLFAAGAAASAGLLNAPLAALLAIVAAVLGDVGMLRLLVEGSVLCLWT